MRRSARRKAFSRFVEVLCAGAVLLALVPLFFVFFYVVQQGFSSLNWDFFTKMPKPVGETGGGMANAIVGTLYLIGIAAAIAIPVGLIAGVYLSEYPRSGLAMATRFTADVLNGIPSIVIGIFAYGLVVMPVKHFSALAGGVALGFMMIPIITRTTEELLNLVPGTLREGALALGATRARAADLSRSGASRGRRQQRRRVDPWKVPSPVPFRADPACGGRMITKRRGA